MAVPPASQKLRNYVKTLGSVPRAGDRPVADGCVAGARHPSTPGHEKPWGNSGGPPSKAKYSWPPIANQYREGKVKSTPGGE